MSKANNDSPAKHRKNASSNASPVSDLHKEAREVSDAFLALETEAQRAAAHVINGPHDQKRFGPGEKFWQFRNYDESDRPQDIDWRQSAKTDHIFIRQKEHQTTQSVLFWCASHAGMEYSSSKKYVQKERAAKVLSLALAILANQGGDLIGAFGSNQRGRGQAALDRIAQRIFTKKDENELPDTSVFKLPQHASVILSGDFLSPIEDIQNRFEHLAARSQNGIVVQILDPAECDLPFSGRAIFEGLDGETKFQIDNIESVRDIYQDRIDAHLSGIKDLCKHLGWHYFFHRTDLDLKSTLADIWETMHQDNKFEQKGL